MRDEDELEARLRRLAGAATPLRRFALSCAQAVATRGSPPPLWTQALALLSARVDETISEGTFRHRAQALERTFPMLEILGGLRRGDPGAAAALSVAAALHSDPLEAALDAARGERLHAALALDSSLGQLRSWPDGVRQSGALEEQQRERARSNCLARQSRRFAMTQAG